MPPQAQTLNIAWLAPCAVMVMLMPAGCWLLASGGEQGELLSVPVIGTVACCGWALGVGYMLLRRLDQAMLGRADADDAAQALNGPSQPAGPELIQLLQDLRAYCDARDFALRGQAERHVDCISTEHNGACQRVASEIGELTDAQRADVAEAVHRAKSGILAHMSHEIRTPLNGVIGMLELLGGGPLDPQQRRFVEVATRSAQSLLSLLNDMLDFAKIEAGKLELERIAFDLPQIVNDVIEIFAHQGGAKGLAIAGRLDAGLPAIVVGDPERLRQVLYNLVGNAVKFTAEGEVVLTVSRHDPGGAGGPDDLYFSVRDTGIGVPAERQHRLFQSFTQVDASTTRKFGGTGLGLAICKQLVEAMGGRIGVDSEYGVGSTFWFHVPLPAAPLAPPCAATAQSGDAPRALVVDDSEVNCLVATEILMAAGYAAEAVRSGRAALDAIAARRYDVVLMDVEMPELDGFATVAEIRRREAAGEAPGSSPDDPLPVVALTAQALQGDRERCLAAGMTDYATKPVDRTELLARVQSCLAARAAGQGAVPLHEVPIAPESAQPAASQLVEPSCDACADEASEAISPEQRCDACYEELLSRCLGKADLADRLLAMFADNLTAAVEALDGHVARGDCLQTARHAHGLKGSAANVAAREVAAAAACLESAARAGAPERLPALFAELQVASDAWRRQFADLLIHGGFAVAPR